MRVVLLALWVLFTLGCGAASPTASEPGGGAACAGELYAGPPADPSSWGPAPDGVVDEVHVAGLRTVPERLVREAIGDRVAVGLDPEWVREDIEAILALEAFDDVRARVEREAGGLILTYEVHERPLIGEVAVVGGALTDRAAERPRSGEVYDPAATQRAVTRLVAHHRAEGYDQATGQAHASRRADRVDVCLALEPGRMRRIASIAPEGNERVPDEELLEMIETRGGRVNVEGGVFDEGALREDQARWSARYYDLGMIQVRIGEPEGSWDDEGRFHVRIPIEEGPVFRIRSVEVRGDLVADPSEYRARLRQGAGDVFDRSLLAESIESIFALERAHGRDRDAVEIFPETEIDGESAQIAIVLQVNELGGAEEEPAPPEGAARADEGEETQPAEGATGGAE